MGIPEKIKAIKDEMHKTQINKATERHIGLLKAKLAKLTREQDESKQRKVGKVRGESFDVRRSGDATVVFIGFPSVGKSTLLNSLTNAKSKIAKYQFTTLTVVPGMMEHRSAKIQILDLPGIIEGASSGKGLGKRVLSVARNADLVLLVLDVFHPNHIVLRKELRNIGIRIDEQPPDVIVEKTSSGGIGVNTQVKLMKISENLIKDILRVYDINNARVIVREDVTDEQFIDVLENRTYVRSLIVMNKIDLVNQNFINELQDKIKIDFIPISADANINIEALKEEIFNTLNFIRIYMRPKNGKPDYDQPLITRNDSTVLAVCNKIHRNMKNEFRYAMVWGKSVKFGGQKVGMNHVLLDEDVLTIVKKL
ncbi:MAG: GTP-binding protein [Thaumarchaeota archaeon]|nr:GTP-binding protein [Nitrososphaerota archaeon]